MGLCDSLILDCILYIKLSNFHEYFWVHLNDKMSSFKNNYTVSSYSYVFMLMSCSFLFSLMTFVLVQNKIAKDSDIQKFDDDDLIVKVGDCLEVRSFIVFH